MSAANEILNVNAKVPALERYTKYLRVLSVFLPKPLTPTEIKIIEEFYWNSNGEITTDSRKKVSENMNISINQLNNYIKALKNRSLIHQNFLHKVFMVKVPEGAEVFINIKMNITQ